MINYEDLKAISVEELNALIRMAETEVSKRNEIKLEEAKTKTVIAIRELLAVCEEAGIYSLGNIYWECDECDHEGESDILYDEILKDVAKILEGK